MHEDVVNAVIRAEQEHSHSTYLRVGTTTEVLPGEPWDLGHVPGSGKQAYAGPQHRRCNRDTTNQRSTSDPDPSPTTRW